MSALISVHKDFDAKLVELVRDNPVLYVNDLRVSPYESMKKKIELWNSIAASMNVEAAYCISRWKCIRDKYRRETQKLHQSAIKSKAGKYVPWELYDKLQFLRKHINYHHLGHQKKQKTRSTHDSQPWINMDAENAIEEVQFDDPLQEPMEQQYNFERDRLDVVTSATSPTRLDHLQPIGNLKRIEALLEGLDDTNRNKAERHIVAYLCKCQLKYLNNEDIDDVTI